MSPCVAVCVKHLALFQCSQCDLYFKVEDDLNAHVGDLHTTLPTAEKERAPDQIADLLLTPIHGQRKDSGTLPSPPSFLSVVCDVHKPGGPGCQEVHAERLSQAKMTLKSMFMKNISTVITLITP